MSNNVFYNIEQRLSDPYTAIDIFNPAAGTYLAKNKYAKDIKLEFPTVEAYLKDFYLSNGIEEIYVYLKKRNGSNAYKAREKAISITFKQAQQEPMAQQPTTHFTAPTNPQANQYYGMAGSDILGLHSRAERLQDALKLIEKVEAENVKLKEATEKLKEDRDDLKYKNRELDFDLKKAKDEADRLEKKLEDKARPLLSDDGLQKATEKLPEMLGMFMAAKNGGMGVAVPQQVQEATIVSEPKQQLINNINLEAFTDEMATESNIVLMGIFSNPEFTEDLRNLLVMHNLVIE